MATGDRKVKIQEVVITYGAPVRFVARWTFSVEDNQGEDRYITGGQAEGIFGTPAQFNAKTGADLKTEARNAVLADLRTPANDDVS